MRKLVALFAAFCLLLCGCSDLMDGEYVSVKPHQGQVSAVSEQALVEVASYLDLRCALQDMVENGADRATISVASFDEKDVEAVMEIAIRYLTKTDPLGAYAVESVDYEKGYSGAVPAVAVTIHYNNNQAELRSIERVEGMEEAQAVITEALAQFESGVVLRVNGYEKIDYAQLLQDYADAYPEKVMEAPQVTVNTYPYDGADRVVEVQFTYQSNRESLRTMQERVQDVFDSAKLYVSGDGADMEKYAQLYAFLTERFDYQYDTSITPAYSLLCHGVGDSRAFAVVYAAMCHRAGLECMVVSGTHVGEPWFWNIICVDGIYYHLDLIHSTDFTVCTDHGMTSYVWDYSAYPSCSGPELPEGTAGETGETTAETAGE